VIGKEKRRGWCLEKYSVKHWEKQMAKLKHLVTGLARLKERHLEKQMLMGFGTERMMEKLMVKPKRSDFAKEIEMARLKEKCLANMMSRLTVMRLEKSLVKLRLMDFVKDWVKERHLDWRKHSVIEKGSTKEILTVTLKR
jgi:hypothetical protein